MKSYVAKHRWWAALKALRRDRTGQVALAFGLSAITIVTGVGAGVDLMRAYSAQQRLSEIASLACQFAKRPSVIKAALETVNDITNTVLPGAVNNATYVSNVTSYLNTAMQGQQFQYTQTNATPFTYATNGPGNVALNSSVPTTFMKLVGATTIPVAAGSHCFDTVTAIVTPTADGNTPLLAESFETNASCGGFSFCFTSPTGQNSTSATPTKAVPATPGYTGSSGTKWYVTGYCVEVDTVGTIRSTVPAGTRSGELDCDNGSGSAGNSAITAKIYLAAGNYELRYNFASRIDYPDYDPVYICGSTAADTAWANSTNAAWPPVPNPLRTNQINVYLDRDLTGTAPMHTTLDGTQQLAGSAMIDTCVHSLNWIQRSIRIKVTAPDNYWLTFAADGQNDSYGGQIDNLMLCQNSCGGAVQDNFPATWLPSGGVNVTLFADGFSELGTIGSSIISQICPYVQFPWICSSQTTTSSFYNTSGNLTSAVGTSGPSSGWPNQSPTGWVTGPINQVTYGIVGGPLLLTDYVVVAGATTSNGSSSRLFNRAFLLDPGFYSLTYYYRSNVVFTTTPSMSCGATPSLAGLGSATGSAAGTIRSTSTPGTYPLNINAVGVFLSNGQMISTPNGGTSYTNPDSNLADTPPVPGATFVAPDAINLTNYTASTTSALLDICGYQSSWTARTINFEIQKTGQYWLTFSSQMATTGTSGSGGTIANVQLTALGSPAMTSPPSNPVIVPAPGTQPGAAISANGYFIVANPLTFPAPAQ